ncbi:MAG: isoprenylcysteine carboxylmethyltransferase family protein [Candidatus Limnocylindrales bacterium]
MGTQAGMSPSEDRPSLATGIALRIGAIAFFLILEAVILFVAAGRLDWTWAWIYLAICVGTVLVNGTLMFRASPETIAERGRPGETQTWDKVVSGLWSLALYLLLPLVAGLDVRFAWSGDLAVAWNVAGAAVLVAGLGLAAWAMLANAYFSTAVRIQGDRGQTVCRSGPYRLVRHPGYVGFILQSFGTALVLGSLWALVPGVAAASLMVIRTALEDRFLQAELPGYRDYTRDVRHRLVPGIW